MKAKKALSPEAVEVLQLFARDYGPRWKAALRAHWERACCALPEQANGRPFQATLQALRNSPDFGPAGLVRYGQAGRR